MPSRILKTILLLSIAAPVSAAAASPLVRIGIAVGVSSVELGAGKLSVESGEKISVLTLREKTPASVSGQRIKIGARDWPDNIFLSPGEDGGSVSINGRLYRGRIELRRSSAGRLTAVNVLPVDDYVRGILLHEVSPDWPMEALKAQAVISRTYALRNRGKHGQEGFDLCNQVHCQVYGGRSSERASIDRAVSATEGEVLFYKGALVNAVFHSACGGYTEDSDDVWQGEAQPYLKSVRCGWCRRSPYYKWTSEIDTGQIARGLRAAGHDVGEPRSLKILSRSRSGRAVTVRVTGSRGSAEMKSNQFRLALNSRVVKSTFWTAVSTGRDRWKFSGHGWGHGAGLCQWGAKEQAAKGRSYEQILKFYYKNVSLTKYRA